MHWFEGILVSGEEHLLKPQPEIYEAILSRFNIDRKLAVFIDDNYKNVVGSEAVGLKAIHFTTPELLAEELKALNVII
jgi:2-haloacid dehalogenase